MSHLTETLFSFFSGAGEEIALLIISMLPIIELRGAIPFGAFMGMDWPWVFCLAVLGNLLPVPFILLLLRPVFHWMKGTRLLRGTTERLEQKILSKQQQVTRYAFWGLLLFVAIPLPGTGAWTGAGIAALLEMKLRPAIVSIAGGVLIAGLIMTILSYGAAELFR